MSDTKEFVNGLIVKAPRDGAPDFVKCAISIRREELISFISSKEGDWINIDVKESKNGKWYAEVDNWKPEQKGQTQPHREQAPQQGSPQQSAPAPTNNDFDQDIPF